MVGLGEGGGGGAVRGGMNFKIRYLYLKKCSYHRLFSSSKDSVYLTQDYIKAMRLFVGEPVWTPHNRPSDDHPARAEYVKKMNGGRYTES